MRRAVWAVALIMALAVGVSGCARTGGAAEPDADDAPTVHRSEQTGETNGMPKPVTLDAAEQARLGVVVSNLTAASAPSGSQTTARVLDPGPLLALDSELAAATASSSASHAEAERTRQLFAEDRTASARAVEAANSQALADRQRVESAQRRIALEWGDGIANLKPDKRAGLLGDLAQVRAELIRVELPPGVAVPSSTVAVRERGDSPELNAIVLGTLPAADPRLQTRGLLVELRGADARLAIGSMLLSRIPVSGGVSGVLLPRSALIRKDSKVWAYVQTAPTIFLRSEVSAYQLLPEGWFVSQGFSPGDRVVTAGAASLFAIEAPAAAAD